MLRSRLVLALICLALAPLSAALASTPPIDWSGVPAGEHVKAWFEAAAAGEPAMRAFFEQHQAPQSLLDRTVEQRLPRWLALRDELGLLTPVRIVASTPEALRILARSEKQGELSIEFRCEPQPPHRLLGLALEIGGPGPGGSPGSPGSPGAPGTRAAGPPLTDKEAVAELDRLLERAAKDGRFSGVALLARAGRPLLTRAVGLAERRFSVPNREHTRFNLGSIGKIFTLVALGQLAEAGKLSLDDALAKYLPSYPDAGRITLDQLARHRAGVGDIFGERYEAADRSKLRHNRDYLALFQDLPLQFAPGSAHAYSNGGYVLLGEVIARASGEDYYDYLARHIFAPAGMASTGADEADIPVPEVAMGYTTGEDGKGPVRENVYTRPARGSAAGGSYATAADLLKLDQALLGGRLLGRAHADWVMGGPRPDRNPGAPAGDGPGFGFAGGAPGVAAEWMHEGELTLIVLANLDPEVVRPVVGELRGILERMRR